LIPFIFRDLGHNFIAMAVEGLMPTSSSPCHFKWQAASCSARSQCTIFRVFGYN
jgi:hypothetical protein